MTSKDTTKPSGTDPSIPYVISPRKTRLDTRQPRLRWNKVKDANYYTVKIFKDSEIVWQKEVKEAEFNSCEALPLEAGVSYSLIVESDNGYSSKTDSDRSLLEFQLLDEDKIRSLPDDAKKITDLGLSVDEETLELANLYFGQKYGLLAKATEILEQRIAADSQTSEIYVTLGNLYLVVGLCSFAEEQYRKALALINPEFELEEQIIAKAGLAKICTLLGHGKEAEVLMQERSAELKVFSINRQSRAITEPYRARALTRMMCNCNNGKGIYYGPSCELTMCAGG
ncbi:MAG: hypothetical protein QNJ70_01795 [Xenococcaceae cyanobacterium MO_207.B15]|nr:hypothetical protein [Xenococcaceae cyanobacterium MO_207.B15]